MRILVLGAGVVGVASAYFLARAGHDVTVIDRQAGPAEETSFGNSGQVSPGYSAPWASPSLPSQMLKWAFAQHSPLIIRPGLDWRLYAWLLAALRNCTAERYARNKDRMVRLAEYSRDCLAEVREQTGIRYDERMRGTLQLLRSQEQLDAVGRDIDVLRRAGVPFELLDRAGCVAAEPALDLVKGKFAGGLRLPRDETGDCRLFTQRLSEHAQKLGVRFLFERSIQRLVAESGRITGAVLHKGEELTAERYVVALGSYSPLLLHPLGIRIPVYPVKGYSITVPIENPDGAPVSTVMDETYKIAITRLGDRIRAGGRAELTGYDRSLKPSRRQALEHSVGDLFPTGGPIGKASFWTGLRPMTPDGTPVIGATPYPNLFLNTGHGTLGWTMSCGSAKVVADAISRKKTDIRTDDLAMSRYS